MKKSIQSSKPGVSKATSPQPRRGRPRLSAEAIDEIKAGIVAAASRLFMTEGFAAVSMRRLAKEAGCTPMTLYAYFSSKNDVMRHIWVEFFDELFAEIDALCQAIPEPKTRLRTISKCYVDYWLTHPERYRMVFLTEDQIAPQEAFFVNATDIVERFQVFLQTLAEAKQASHGAANRSAGEGTDIQACGEALVCALNGIAHNLITISEYPWVSAERLLDVILEGLIATSQSNT